MNPHNELISHLSTALESYSADIPVSAESLANIVINNIDAKKSAPVLVRYGCVLELRQMARQLLRREFDEEPDHPQEELFQGLQDRYPGTGEQKGVYLPRTLMTEADYRFNIARLRNEANAKLRHADALEAEMEKRLKRNDWDNPNLQQK